MSDIPGRAGGSPIRKKSVSYKVREGDAPPLGRDEAAPTGVISVNYCIQAALQNLQGSSVGLLSSLAHHLPALHVVQ